MLALLAATPVLAWTAWFWGRRDAALISSVWTFQVNGSSMAPTLLGRYRIARCDACKMTWRVDPSPPPSQSAAICSHCGDRLTLLDPTTTDRADTVMIEKIDAPLAGLRRGDLVAVQWDDQLHLKRISALPGEVVTLDGLRLRVDGERLEDLMVRDGVPIELPWFLVDHDASRPLSRWSPAEDRAGWRRTEDRQWDCSGAGHAGWIVYHHQSIHDHQLPSPVWDDYPFNIGLQRKLYPVDRFRCRGIIDSPTTVTLEVAFWSEDGNRLARSTFEGDQEFSLAYHDALPAGSLPVGPHHPVAIRVIGGRARLDELSIDRLIEYRLRPHDDRQRYPLNIGPDEYFVLGDNVPVSIDSRNVGAIPAAHIIGRVRRRPEQAPRNSGME